MRALALALLLAPASGAQAVQADEVLANPVLEARARALSAELRCLVCQNESIDDSNADLAKDIRVLLRDRLKAGDDEAAIRRFLVARYGNFILLKPPVNRETILLWLTPVLALAFGGVAIWRASRSAARRAASPGPLDEAEEARLRALMSDSG
jgi:cytochrome c-type biogenesis protein CcmH